MYRDLVGNQLFVAKLEVFGHHLARFLVVHLEFTLHQNGFGEVYV